MNKKTIGRIFPLALAGVLAMGALTAMADDAATIPFTEPPLEEGSMLTDLFGQEGFSVFEHIRGEVELVHETNDGQPVLRIAGGEEWETADFLISEKTVFVDDKGLTDISAFQEGMTATAYYVRPEMMTMIYPAQYTAEVLVLGNGQDYDRAGVSYFTLENEQLLNSERDLFIHVNEDAEVITPDGQPYTGGLEDKTLIIFYDIVALSYPGQTSPDTIIVLDYVPEEKSEAAPPEPVNDGLDLPQVMDKLNPEDFDNMIIMVNGVYLEDVHVYRDGEDVLFPLSAIAKALDYPVAWDGETQRITLGVAITLTIGENEYIMGRMAPQTMETAPILVNDTTYVSGDFIQTALGAVIDISNGYYNITTDQD